MLGVISLIGAGLFSVLLVASRMPLVQNFFPSADFFRVALVVHVGLQVLVCFVAFAGVFWSLNCTGAWLAGGWAALLVSNAGAVAVAAAAFVGSPQPIMSNYGRALDSPLFLGGLLALAAGVGLVVLRAMRFVPRVGVVLDGQGGAALRAERRGGVRRDRARGVRLVMTGSACGA